MSRSFSSSSRAGFLHDERLDDLPPEQILLADNADLLHCRMEAEDDLDLPGVDVEAAGDDHPLLPAGEKDVPILIHPAEVARVEPAVFQDLGGHLVVVVVSLHDVVAPEDQFADGLPRELPVLAVDDPRLHAGDGDADGSRFLRHVEAAERGDGRCLGEAVPLHDLGAEPLLENGDEFGGHRRAPGDAELQGIGPVFLGAGMEKHAEEEPRDGRDIGHPFPLDGGEDPVEGETVHQDGGRADPQWCQHVRDCAKRVEEGDDRQADIVCRPYGRSSSGGPTGSGGCDG